MNFELRISNFGFCFFNKTRKDFIYCDSLLCKWTKRLNWKVSNIFCYQKVTLTFRE